MFDQVELFEILVPSHSLDGRQNQFKNFEGTNEEPSVSCFVRPPLNRLQSSLHLGIGMQLPNTRILPVLTQSLDTADNCRLKPYAHFFSFFGSSN